MRHLFTFLFIVVFISTNSFAQKVYVPDDNFEQLLIDLKYDSGALDDSVSYDVVRVIKNIDLENRGIGDLTGIENFIELTTLRCNDNNLTELDVSELEKLEFLYCYNNEISRIIFGDNNALQTLTCYDNQLTEIDLSGVPNLLNFRCDINFLTELDVSKCSKLHFFSCLFNNLTEIDITNNSDLTTFYCSSNSISELDVTKNPLLEYFMCAHNNLQKLDVTNNPNLIELWCGENSISALDVTNCNSLKEIHTWDNLLTELDLSQCVFLEILSCGRNKLNSLDVSQCPYLIEISAFDNLFSTIDLHNNPNLKEVSCNGSFLNVLNIANGNNYDIEYFVTSQSPNLYCIQVDDASIANNLAGWSKDSRASYSDNCAIPEADAGPSFTVNERETGYLDGSASYDNYGDDLTYKWTAPEGIVLSSDTEMQPTFMAPEVTEDTDFQFGLVVNDGEIDSEVDYITVEVKQVNIPPVANAGEDQEVDERTVVTLDGSSSTDEDGVSLSYSWVAPEGITLSADDIFNPTFETEVKADTTLNFILTVNDGEFDSEPDTVSVTVKQVNIAPVANAGEDQVADERTVITLDGSLSADEDDKPITYLWTAPEGMTLSADDIFNPTFETEVSVDTTFNFVLTVNDGELTSEPDTVSVEVKQINRSPVADAGMDTYVAEKSVVTLDGQNSNDIDGDDITYEWISPEGIELDSYTTASPSFISPEVAVETDFEFSLMVTDEWGESSEVATVTYTVKPLADVALSVYLDDELVGDSVYQVGFYLEEGTDYTVTEVSQLENGQFELNEGNWIIKVSPTEEEVSFISMYWGDQISWTEADLLSVSLGETYQLTIHVEGYEEPEVGNNQLSGTVYEEDANGDFGSALADINVMLFQEGNTNPVASDYTDEQGGYEFEGLPDGEFEIEVEIPGFEIEKTMSVSLDEMTPEEIYNVSIDSQEHMITSTVVLEESIGVTVYPNPTADKIEIHKTGESLKNTKVTISSVTGMQIYNREYSQLQTEEIDLSSQPAGLYILNIYDGEALSTFKIIKK